MCWISTTVIRSVHHQFADHGGGHKRFLTARDPKQPDGFVNDTPMVGSMISKMREQIELGLPNYVSLVDGGRQHIDTFSFGSAHLPPSTTRSSSSAIPAGGVKVETSDCWKDWLTVSMAAQLLIAVRQVPSRRRYDQADGRARQIRPAASLGLATSQKARDACRSFAGARNHGDRYGHNPFGRASLDARRLVEAGCSFVSPRDGKLLVLRPAVSGRVRLQLGQSRRQLPHLEDARVRFPIYDQAVTALIEDIYARGLDKPRALASDRRIRPHAATGIP